MAKNLIKNPCGEEDLEHWEVVENGGDEWKVEDLPGDCGAPFPSDGVSKYFVTSFELCKKSQLIDLLQEGFTEEVLDAQPNIVVSDWYGARTDCGCCYELRVQLLSDSRDVISEYSSENITIPENTDGAWNQDLYKGQILHRKYPKYSTTNCAEIHRSAVSITHERIKYTAQLSVSDEWNRYTAQKTVSHRRGLDTQLSRGYHTGED
ncbi:F-box only protein 2 isoform X1 [Dendrobates tinctorius]|uniref:F-box only protein 2 isoform X1 n=1 Tax=Dendrobates tinctorius TaxID=92724 RepID=UPI003CCA12D3